jgi:hypothetical protein
MGAPILPETDARWQSRNPAEPGSALTARCFIDTPPTGWFACHYRAVAVAATDVANGRMPGVSQASASVRLAIAPAGPPRLASAAKLAGNATVWLISFTTDLPTRTDVGGPARVELIDLVSTRPNRRTLLAMEFVTIEQGGALTAADLAAGAGRARRGTPAVDRMVAVTLTVAAPAGTLILRVIDPLGRSADVSLGKV